MLPQCNKTKVTTITIMAITMKHPITFIRPQLHQHCIAFNYTFTFTTLIMNEWVSEWRHACMYNTACIHNTLIYRACIACGIAIDKINHTIAPDNGCVEVETRKALYLRQACCIHSILIRIWTWTWSICVYIWTRSCRRTSLMWCTLQNENINKIFFSLCGYVCSTPSWNQNTETNAATTKTTIII